MHFRHRQTDTDIVAQARDVSYTSRAKNCRDWSSKFGDNWQDAL